METALPAAIDALAVGGRIVVLSYHSLEDRITKRVFADRARSSSPPDLPVELPGTGPTIRLLSRGAELASPEEIAANPRAASVRLRAAERIAAGESARSESDPTAATRGGGTGGSREDRTSRRLGAERRPLTDDITLRSQHSHWPESEGEGI